MTLLAYWRGPGLELALEPAFEQASQTYAAFRNKDESRTRGDVTAPSLPHPRIKTAAAALQTPSVCIPAARSATVSHQAARKVLHPPNGHGIRQLTDRLTQVPIDIANLRRPTSRPQWQLDPSSQPSPSSSWLAASSSNSSSSSPASSPPPH